MIFLQKAIDWSRTWRECQAGQCFNWGTGAALFTATHRSDTFSPRGGLLLNLPCQTAARRFRLTQYARKTAMNITRNLIPTVSPIAGILILAVPRLLPPIVAVYLIMVGLVSLFGSGQIFH